MTVRNLEFLFRPKSVAVVSDAGPRSRHTRDSASRRASGNPRAQGADGPSLYAEVVLRNLAAGGFSGPVNAVTAKKRSLFGIGAHIHIDELDVVPDLAVVCAALDDVPQIIAQLGARGTRAVIVGPSLREKMTGSEVLDVRKAILDAARPYLIRVLGPGSGGLVVPASGLNASVATVTATPGKIALVAQSTAVAAAVLERACSKGIGFSSVLHLGASIDIDLADVLDWLAADPDTEAILVQFDTVTVGRKFMSAARAAARNKPVVAIRGARVEARRPGDRPFTTDDVYEAALRRAGWVRIDTLEDLFDAAEAMARVRPMRGERLSILGNGHGLGRIAGDALLRFGGRLATLSKDTVRELDELLRTGSPPGNPLALPAGITPANWAAALTAVLADRETDAVLTVCSPSPFASSADVATAICKVAADTERNVFTCWVGGTAMLEAQHIAAAHGVLSHDSPEKAIAIFQGIVNYVRNRKLLVQMPPSVAEDFTPDIDAARGAVVEAINAGTATLSARQARNLLQAYGIDAAEYPQACSIDAAILAADDIGYPVDLGLVLANSTEHEAVAAGLRSPADIHIAARGLRSSVREQRPGIRISGYRLRPSAARSGIAALRLGVADDPVFGPVIFLAPASAAGVRGYGLVAALPPLNLALAQDLVARSRFAEEAPDSERAALESAVTTALVRLSQVLTDIDEVAGVELDPVHVETTGVVALDVRIRIEKRGRKLGFRRFAIRPYPKELERKVDWDGRHLLIRPIRPEDETTLGDLIGSLDPEDARMRFFGTMRSLPRSQLARFTQIDYDREMALVAIERGSDGVERSLGEVRAVTDPDNAVADFAIVVSSEIKGKGLGRLLLASIIDYSRSRGTGELRGETMAGNLRMQHLAQNLGFKLKTGADIGTIDLRLALRAHQAE
ncbi:MAG: GNAT family N-acetyltransferase [Rhodocyclaceae bacterium]|nr:GNAT family N-acetyltransferase [Rhodocyclaceae bacterium]